MNLKSVQVSVDTISALISCLFWQTNYNGFENCGFSQDDSVTEKASTIYR
jgi:hypothetical protein